VLGVCSNFLKCPSTATEKLHVGWEIASLLEAGLRMLFSTAAELVQPAGCAELQVCRLNRMCALKILCSSSHSRCC
jgi:hypothetical protein